MDRAETAAAMMETINLVGLEEITEGVDAKAIGEALLDLIEDILQDVADGSQDFPTVKRQFRRQVNQYRRQVWREYILPTLQGIKSDDWVEDALLAVTLIRLLLKRL